MNCFDIMKFCFHRFGFGSNFIRRHTSDNVFGHFHERNFIFSFGFDVRSSAQGTKIKNCSLKNQNKAFQTDCKGREKAVKDLRY